MKANGGVQISPKGLSYIYIYWNTLYVWYVWYIYIYKQLSNMLKVFDSPPASKPFYIWTSHPSSWYSHGLHLLSLPLPWCFPEILMAERIGSHHLGVSIPHCHFFLFGIFQFHITFVHNILGFFTNIYRRDQTIAYQTWSNYIQKRSGFHCASSHFWLVLFPWGQPTWIASGSKSTNFTDFPKNSN